ncbi:MAG TPA: hypothetical protein VEC19_08765 [Usitatibacter sp.]|nr:hypothetical protein [Usitatibacter sp.]
MLTRPHPLERRAQAVPTWQRRLRETSTPAEVIEVAREFVASWGPEEMAELPPACRPRKLVDAEDVSSYALALVQHSCAADHLGDSALQRMAAFFTSAAQQISHLAFTQARLSEQ